MHGTSHENIWYINDDWMERSLEKLFDAYRSSLITELVVLAVQEFDLDMNRFHNDSTFVALSGLYRKADRKEIRSKKTIKRTFGHRKDLRHLVWILILTANGSVPLH